MVVRIKSEIDPYSFKNYWLMEMLFLTNNAVTSSRMFYLGDPHNFCKKVLSVDPSYIIEIIGSINFKLIRDQQKLGKFIATRLDLDDVEMEVIKYDDFFNMYLK